MPRPTGTPHTPFNQNEYDGVHFLDLEAVSLSNWENKRKIISMQLYPPQHWPCNHQEKYQNSHLSLVHLEACLRLGKFPAAIYHFPPTLKTMFPSCFAADVSVQVGKESQYWSPTKISIRTDKLFYKGPESKYFLLWELCSLCYNYSMLYHSTKAFIRSM